MIGINLKMGERRVRMIENRIRVVEIGGERGYLRLMIEVGYWFEVE